MTTITLQPDPTAGIDTFIQNGGLADWNLGIGSNLQTGLEVGEIRRGLIKFDLSSLPSGITIVSATLRLRCTGAANSNATNVSIHRSLVQWIEGFQNGATPPGGEDGSTWNHRNHNGSVAWTGGAGGASGTEWVASATDTTSVSTTSTEYDWDVTADVVAFYTGAATNHGWWMLGDEVTADTRKAFRTSDGLEASRPWLFIEYIGVDVSDTASIAEVVTVAALEPGVSHDISVADAVSLADSTTVLVANYAIVVADAVAVIDTAEVYPLYRLVSVTDAVDVTDAAEAFLPFFATSVSDSISAGETLAFEIISPFAIASRSATPEPLLYITDGMLKSNGQLNKIDLIGGHGAYCVEEWMPAVVQWKEGGHWSDSPLATGRRPIMRRFANVIDVFTLKARAPTQDGLIAYINDLDDLLEAAANYHISRWSNTPIYLVARAAYETNTRYALIYAGDVPELGDVSGQPFMTYHNRHAAFSELTLRIEHGIWQHLPPGQSEAVPISSFRSYTVTGWSS